MDSYGFWQDFFQTYRSSPDVIKALWLISPTVCVLGGLWIVFNRPRT
ncbi:MAG: hypothetical protein M9924_02965 [Rhizobiaceae bacterium]|nr:hypothetical protein [Rhizobiaceae bacterium]